MICGIQPNLVSLDCPTSVTVIQSSVSFGPYERRRKENELEKVRSEQRKST